MFSGFWGWFLVFVLVFAIFSADRLPELKEFIERMTKDGVDTIKKSAKVAQEKVAKAKAEKKNSNKEDKSEE